MWCALHQPSRTHLIESLALIVSAYTLAISHAHLQKFRLQPTSSCICEYKAITVHTTISCSVWVVLRPTGNRGVIVLHLPGGDKRFGPATPSGDCVTAFWQLAF